MSRLTTILLAGLFLCAFVAQTPLRAQSQEVELLASKDNTLIESSSGSLSNGAGSFLFFGRTNQAQDGTRRALIGFDVAAGLPAGAVIESVVLRVTVNKTSSGAATATVHRVLQDWGEGTSTASGNEGAGAASTMNDATWVHSFFDTEEWQTVGGNFDSGVLTSASAGPLGELDFPSTPDFVGAVQSWVDTPSDDFGLVILGNENNSSTAKRIGSREGAESDQPRLIVTYSVATASEHAELPAFLTSLSAYPNPLENRATIAYELEDARRVRIDLVDVTGRVVGTPVSRTLPAGTHFAELDARDLTPGLYLVRLTADGETAAKTIIVY